MTIQINEEWKNNEIEKNKKKEITLSLTTSEIDEINQALINWSNDCQTYSLRTRNRDRQETQKQKAQKALELAVMIQQLNK